MNLRRIQPGLLQCFADRPTRLPDEHARLRHPFRQPRGDLGYLVGGHPPRAFREYKAQCVRTRIHRRLRVFQIGEAANLHPSPLRQACGLRTHASNSRKASPGEGRRISDSPTRNA